METKFEFKGAGGELFVKMLVGGLLSAITLGIYGPWFLVSLTKWMASKSKLLTPRGEVELEFNATGGQLFVTLLVGGLLTGITFGIYGAWFLANLSKFLAHNTVARGADGKTYTLDLAVTGGELLVAVLVGGLLSAITLGIYLPWAYCKVARLLASKLQILEDGQALGTCEYTGQGGEFLVLNLVGMLLSSITLGIYLPWFLVKTMKFQARSFTVIVQGQRYSGEFAGTGGSLFGTLILGSILSSITMGIYSAWFTCKLTRYYADNLSYRAN